MKTLLRGAATLLTAALLCRMQGGAGQAPPAQGETIPLPALDAVIAQAAVTYLKLCGFVLYFRLLAAGCGALLPQPWAALPAMLLEVCSGCDQAARTGLWASTLCCAALSVQGVSVLLQVRTICPAEISLRPLLAARAVHLPLSVALFWLGSTVPVQAVQTFTTLTERVVVLRRVPLLLPARRHWAVGQHLYWELFSQSISMGLMSSIVSAGSVVLQYGINGLGTLTIAGHTAARKLFSFTSMPLISMANAGSTFVSQNRGAAQPERVRKGMRTMYLCSVVIMAAEVVLMQLFARQLVQLISGSSAPLVLENGARYLMWNAPFYAVLGVLLCTRYALQSLGQKVLPLFSSVIELVGKVIFVLVFIPKFQYNAVILCEPIIWCFMAAYLVAVYLHDPFVFPKKKK